MYTHQFRIFDFLPTEMPFPASADIMGTTTSPRQNVTLKVNGTTYTVKSDSQGRFYFNVPSGTTVTSLYQMCKDQTAIATIDVTGLDTSSCTDMSEMFRGCTGLTSADVTGLDTDSVTTFTNMFNGCASLTTITGIKGFDTSSALYMNQMFYNCSSLTGLDLNGWDTDQVTGMSSMFYGCSSLTSLDLRTFDTTGVMTSGNWTYIVPNSSSLSVRYKPGKFSETIMTTYSNVNWIPVIGNKIYGTTTEPNKTIKFRINEAYRSVTSDDNGDFVLDLTGVTITSLKNTATTQDQSLINYLQTVVYDIDTSNCTSTERMLEYCRNVTSIDFLNFDTSNVTTMAYMFSTCDAVTSITGTSRFNTSKCAHFEQMFVGCKFSSIDVSSFDTSSAEHMNYMFAYCENMTSIDVSGFNTQLVTDIGGMFKNNSSLTSINLSTFTCPDLISIKELFYGCTSLTNVDMSNFVGKYISNSSGIRDAFPDRNTLTVRYDSSKMNGNFFSQISSAFSSVNWVDVA